MYLAVLLLLHAPANVNVAVEPLSGSKQVGTLVELDSQHIAIAVDGQRRSFDMRDLLSVAARRDEVPPTTSAAVWVELVDGSRILAQQYAAKDRTSEVEWGDRTISLETRNVRSVRFQAPSEALDGQWKEILAEEKTGDVIVLHRSKTSLDQLTGIFHDVTPDTVQFEYDGRTIPVKRTKLEGMVYHHPAGRDLPEALCTVQEVNGTSWKVKSVKLQDDRLQVDTVGGTHCDIPWSALARFDFSAGNVAYLSDLDFDLAQCTPFIASQVSAKRILQMYGPRRDNSFEGSGLWLGRGTDIQQYDRGLAIHSRSELVYRLTEPYRKLTAMVGIDSRLQGRGNLVLVISGDGRELFRRTISGKDPPFPLDVNIEGVRRLRILVDFGETLDVADHLNLCNARIVK